MHNKCNGTLIIPRPSLPTPPHPTPNLGPWRNVCLPRNLFLVPKKVPPWCASLLYQPLIADSWGRGCGEMHLGGAHQSTRRIFLDPWFSVALKSWVLNSRGLGIQPFQRRILHPGWRRECFLVWEGILEGSYFISRFPAHTSAFNPAMPLPSEGSAVWEAEPSLPRS